MYYNIIIIYEKSKKIGIFGHFFKTPYPQRPVSVPELHEYSFKPFVQHPYPVKITALLSVQIGSDEKACVKCTRSLVNRSKFGVFNNGCPTRFKSVHA